MAVKQILGVDPGTTNLGYCLIDAVTGAVVRDGNVAINFDKSVKGAHAKIATGVVNSLRGQLADAQFSAVEQQMRARMHVVCGAAMGASVALGVPTAGVAPSSVKTHFGIPLTGNHEANKKLALQFVRNQGVDCTNSHTADAYLCARYAAEVILKTKPYTHYERQPTVPNSRRRIRRTGVLPIPRGDVRVPCPQAVCIAAPEFKQWATTPLGPSLFGPKRLCQSKQVSSGSVETAAS